MRVASKSFLTKKDEIQLERAVKEIKSIPGVLGIVQIGSSVSSSKYNDIDLIIFFKRLLVPPELELIRKKYKKSKMWIEGASIIYKDFNPGFKVFVKFFSNIKNKKLLFGKIPFGKSKIQLKKTDIAAYIWYHYHICEQYGQGYENALPNSINAMLSYLDIFPESKVQTLELFIKKFPKLSKYLPKNPKAFLRGTKKSNFKQLYTFFEQSLNYFTE